MSDNKIDLELEEGSVLDPKILELFVEYLSSVLDCEQEEDKDRLLKKDAMRVARHKKLCETFKIDYDWHKHDVDLGEEFGNAHLKRYFNGDVVEAAKYAYRKVLDEQSKYDRFKTSYRSYKYLRKDFLSVKKHADELVAGLQEEFDARHAWWTEHVYNSKNREEVDKVLEDAKITVWKVASEHDFNGAKSILRSRIECADRFTKDLCERDCTEANIEAYCIDVKTVESILAPSFLLNWKQNKEFARVKELDYFKKYKKGKN